MSIIINNNLINPYHFDADPDVSLDSRTYGVKCFWCNSRNVYIISIPDDDGYHVKCNECSRSSYSSSYEELIDITL